MWLLDSLHLFVVIVSKQYVIFKFAGESGLHVYLHLHLSIYMLTINFRCIYNVLALYIASEANNKLQYLS